MYLIKNIFLRLKIKSFITVANPLAAGALFLATLIFSASSFSIFAQACAPDSGEHHTYDEYFVNPRCGLWDFPCIGSQCVVNEGYGNQCNAGIANNCLAKTNQLSEGECTAIGYAFPCYYTNIWPQPPCSTCGSTAAAANPLCGSDEYTPSVCTVAPDAACPTSTVPIPDTDTPVTIEVRGVKNVPRDEGHVYGLMWFNSENSSNAVRVDLERQNDALGNYTGIYRKTFTPCATYGKCYSGTANEMLWFDVWMSNDNIGSDTFYCDDANFWTTPPTTSEDPPYASLAIENLTRSLYYSTADAVFINDNERVRVIGQGFSNPSSPDINQMNLRSCSSSQTCLDANSSTTVATSSTGIVETELSFSAGAVIRYLVNARNTTAAELISGALDILIRARS